MGTLGHSTNYDDSDALNTAARVSQLPQALVVRASSQGIFFTDFY